jgi:putative transport protein
VGRRKDMDAIARYFGDSYRALSEVDVLTFSLGLSLGLLAGLVPLYHNASLTIRLGFAGGPLVIALMLGALGRTGSLLWTLPYSANLTLRQLGLILFLSGIGTRAGFSFVATLQHGGGISILIAGALITCVVALLALWIGYRLLKIPMSQLMGILAGIQTQPAVLAFALEETGNELPNLGYAAAFPIALIMKIILAQVIVSML